jgi:hypothetical protein
VAVLLGLNVSFTADATPKDRLVRLNDAAAEADSLFGRKQTPVVRREYKGEGEWLVRPAAGEAVVREPKPGEERSFEVAEGVKMVFC